MSAPLSKGHDVEKIERFWHEEEGRMRYMMVHKEACRRCLGLSTEELVVDFNAIQDESGDRVIMVFPNLDGGWLVV